LGAVAVLATTVILGTSGAMAANQNAANSADSTAANASLTHQGAGQNQNANSSSGAGNCEFCTGGGGNLTLQDQALGQAAFTGQWAESAALAKQNAVNANVPVTIVGKGHVDPGSSSANQNAANSADSNASNASATKQDADQNQNANSSSGSGGGKFSTGGGGNITKQGQDLAQLAATEQWAASAALAKQNAVNANVPVTIVGSSDWGKDGHDGIDSKGSGANQNAANSANSTAANASLTKQNANQNQNANSSSGSGGGKFSTGGGGNITGQAQDLAQLAKTQQHAISASLAAQLATNAATPVNIG
jgi:hypothetical protein